MRYLFSVPNSIYFWELCPSDSDILLNICTSSYLLYWILNLFTHKYIFQCCLFTDSTLLTTMCKAWTKPSGYVWEHRSPCSHGICILTRETGFTGCSWVSIYPPSEHTLITLLETLKIIERLWCISSQIVLGIRLLVFHLYSWQFIYAYVFSHQLYFEDFPVYIFKTSHLYFIATYRTLLYHNTQCTFNSAYLKQNLSLPTFSNLYLHLSLPAPQTQDFILF